MNIQFVIPEGDSRSSEIQEAQVLEVNPRASRTVPYLSKITGVPMVKAATHAMLGRSLKEQGFSGGLYPNAHMIAVKAPVFSFPKLTGVDVQLGPEMKSTGEIMGIDTDYGRALYKAMVASGVDVPARGKLLATIANHDKAESLDVIRSFVRIGYEVYATEGTARFLREHGVTAAPVMKIREGAPNLLDLVRGGQVHLMINTLSPDKQTEREALQIRRTSVEMGIPCITSLDTARALLVALEARARGEEFALESVSEYAAG
jgi:carbamoyl-phosphate synthase large subunit